MSIQLRSAVPADAPALLAIYAPYVEQTAITFECDVPAEAEFTRRIADTLQNYPYLVAEQDGVPVGYAYAGKFHERAAYDWSVETSIYVEQHRKRQGIGRLLHDALEQELQRRHFLNMNACVACPIGENDPYLTRDSICFHEKLGYRMVGEFHQCGYKFGRWYHMVWLEKHIGSRGNAAAGTAGIISTMDLRERICVKIFLVLLTNLPFSGIIRSRKFLQYPLHGIRRTHT